MKSSMRGNLDVKLPSPYLKRGKVATSSSKEGLDSRAAKSIASQPWSPGRAFLEWCLEGSQVAPRLREQDFDHLACLPRVQQGACWLSTPHVLAVSWMTATARSLLCSQTSHQSLRSVNTNHPWPLSLCAPLFRKPTSCLILHGPLSVLMVQNTSMSGFRERECLQVTQFWAFWGPRNINGRRCTPGNTHLLRSLLLFHAIAYDDVHHFSSKPLNYPLETAFLS